MFRLYEYECPCGNRFDALQEVEKRDTCVCPECQGEAKHIISSVKSWVVDAERTGRQLKERSKEHTLKMAKRGHDPRQEGSKRPKRSRSYKKGLVKDSQQVAKDAEAYQKEIKTEAEAKAEAAIAQLPTKSTTKKGKG